MNILLTAIGSAAAKDAQKALKKAKHKVYGCDIYPKEWLWGASGFAEVFQVPLAKESGFADALLEIAEKQHIDMIIPLTDLECDVLAPEKARFAEQGIHLACLDAPLQAICRNKLRLPERLCSICTTIPSFPRDAQLNEGFPYLLKPNKGRSSQHQLIARSKEELDAFRSLRSDYIIQPYIKGSVFTVDAVRDSMGGCMCLVRKELLRTVNGLGTTVECYKAHELEEICAHILQELDIIGTVNLEFIQAEEQYYFLEINPRFSGGIGFSRMAGYDFVNAHVRAHIGKAISLEHKKKNRLIVQGYKKKIQ